MEKKKQIILIFSLIIILFTLINSVNAETITTISNTTAEGIKGNIGSYDTIYLNPGTYSGANNTNFTINKNVKIIGNGSKENIIIRGSMNNNTFIIEENVKVTFINITFMAGKIRNGGNLFIDHCTFSSRSTISSGSGYGNGFGGGAILNTGNITINNSIFTNCSSNYGGAICNLGNLSILNSNFTNNAARGAIGSGDIQYHYGGAIYSVGFLNITNCNFINNTAYQGGCILAYKGELIISNSRLENNEALWVQKPNGSPYGDGYGAGIFNYDCKLTVENCIFRNYAYISNEKYGTIGYEIHSNIDFILKNTSFQRGTLYAYLPNTTINQVADPPQNQINNTPPTNLTNNTPPTYQTNNTPPINPMNTYITLTNLIGTYNKITRLGVLLADEKGNTIKNVKIDFNINGNKYTATTDNNGWAYLDYKFTQTGKHTIQVYYSGNTIFKSSDKTAHLEIPKHSLIKVKNKATIKKKKFTYESVIGNLGYDKAILKISYKLPKGITYVKPKVSIGKIIYNKKTRVLTWTINNLKVHKTNSATLTWNLKAKTGKYNLKPTITKATGLIIASNNNLKFKIR